MRKPATILIFVLGIGACEGASEPEPASSTTASAVSASSEKLVNYYVVLDGPSAVEALPAGLDARTAKAASITRRRIGEIEAKQAEIRPALEKLGATFVASFSRLSNAIQILAKPSETERMRHVPGVSRIEIVPLMKPSLSSALPVVGAPAVWAKSTPYQGDGITIGVIDSGVDYTHADFGGAGTPEAYTANDPKIIEPGSFPTTKVIGGYDFVGDNYNPQANINLQEPDPDPLDCVKPEAPYISGGHGTHVSGIATGLGVAADGTTFSGAYEQTFVPAAFKIAPGVAPKAKLFIMKIFGCDGSTGALGQALERSVDPNGDGAFDDRLDVVNASLGTSYGLESPNTMTMVDNLAKAGSLFVAAAGNDGQNFYDVSSPSVVPSALSVAASSDNQFVVVSVESPASIVGDYVAAEAGSTKRLAEVGKITNQLVLANPVHGCEEFANAASVAGKVVVMDRGGCFSSTKFKNAVTAGATAIILVDDEEDVLPFGIGGGDPGSISIPGVLIRKQDGDKIKAVLASEPVGVSIDPQKPYVGPGTELLAGFSGRGPSPIDDRLKPEIAAPGFAIDSARVGSGNLSRRSQGTSMASPVVAGAAALVRQAQPTLGPLQVKAALVNGAESIKSLKEIPYAVSSVGGGRLAVDRSVDLPVTAAADPTNGDVGVSFGSLVAFEATTSKKSFVVENHGTTDATFALAVQPTHDLPGVKVTATPTSITVPAGQTTTVELELALDPATLGSPGPDPTTTPTQQEQPRHYLNEASGVVRLTSATPAYDLSVPYLGSVRAAGHRKAKPVTGCATPDAPLSVEIEGDTPHPEPVISAFKLVTEDPKRDESDTDPDQAMVDIRAVGVATNITTAESWDTASVYFGVAIEGEWTTPARGLISMVSVEVDTDQSGAADYLIRTEPLSKDGPYADLLVATTYNLNEPTAEPSRRLINLATSETAATAPFHNSVIVLPAYLAMLGLSEEYPLFDFKVVTESPKYGLIVNFGSAGESTYWTTFDANNPGVDPAKPGPEGRPLYVGKGPVLVDVSPAALESEEPPKLLLLHHTNVAGQRWEIVDLPAQSDGNLALTTAPNPASIASTETSSVVLTAKNTGKTAADSVAITGTLTGGTIVEIKASQGSCKAGATVDCDLGSLAAGASATATVTVKPSDKSTKVDISAAVESTLGCESVLTDNKTQALVEVTSPTSKKKDVSASGGCGCRAQPSSTPTGALAALVLALGASLARMRNRRARR